MLRAVRPPYLVRKYYPGLVWRVNTFEKELFLTFDDGPTPGVTEEVLEILKLYNAKATFFCLGKNVTKHPNLYSRIMAEGHATGNHTTGHLNGWQTRTKGYLEDIEKSRELIDSTLFRPPYGRITKEQIKGIVPAYKIVMWDVLSWDFDEEISSSEVLRNVCEQSRPGSIVVFHDSQKAKRNVLEVLPKCLRFFSGKGYAFKALN